MQGILFSRKIKVEPHDTVETLAQKIHALEYTYYPQVIAGLLSQDLAVEKLLEPLTFTLFYRHCLEPARA